MTRPASLGWLCFWAPLAFALTACQEQEQQDIPNRVLDRPTDVALICAEAICEDLDGDGVEEDDECVIEPLPVEQCDRDSGTCSSDNPHLVGFVANSERNEIAMFTKCSNRLVDMNVEVPGYNFVPAGILPTDLDASADSCRVMSANVGSCDITVLDAFRFAAIGLGRATAVDEPAALVTTILPRRFDQGSGSWIPLGSRPGEILSAPKDLSQAPSLDPDGTLEGVCDPLAPASAYVSFPSCNLVAEVDLRTGHVLQSRQFIGDGDGNVTVVDTGVTPVCPVECPAQFEDGLPGDVPLVDAAGPFPQALELDVPPVEPIQNPDPTPSDPNSEPTAPNELDEAEKARADDDNTYLYIGGLGSDLLFELRIAESGAWEVTNQLQLSDASGIKRIRVSPPVDTPALGSSYSQFFYVIAGDGSTRVVARGLDAAEDDVVGVECETQLDPNVLALGAELACVPVGTTPTEGQPTERRGFARGPGIRPAGGEEITDWMFRKVYAEDAGSGPFDEAGTVAVGVTSGGRAVYSMINQERANGETTVEQLARGSVDPVDIMDVRLFPHSLWPDPNADTVLGLPTVLDEPPEIAYGAGQGGPTRNIAPSLRQIDSTYAGDSLASTLLNVVANYDRLGAGGLTEDEQQASLILYEEDVARVVVHDYRSWGQGTWTLEWEATIPGTPSGTGRFSCDNPGWEGGTCLASGEGMKLVDESANFCDNGVLPGDKLVIPGCREDDQCGDGRRCLRETVAGGESTGICISAQAYEERASDLRQICANFISDPCGEAYREFTVVEARQDELWLQSMDQPLTSYLLDSSCEDGDNNVLVDGVCECLPGYTEEACGGADNPDVVDCCPDPDAEQIQLVSEAEDRLICADEQPEDGCASDRQCRELLGDDQPWVCVEDRCRRPCEDADECTFRRLPGPTCFGEFVTYQVALRNAFRVNGPGVGFVSALVDADPDGFCRETADTNVSRLLTSRLPLPASDDPDNPDWLAIPVCPSDEVGPGDPNPCRIVASRGASARFHNFEYLGEEVSALRFSNPVFSIVLDLASLVGLTDAIPGSDGVQWPPEFARFRRSRIPRGYRQTFRLDTGYVHFADFLTLEGRPITLPVRIIPGPQSNVAFIVDGSGPGSSSSIRGQVVRVFLGEQVQADEAFIGVR